MLPTKTISDEQLVLQYQRGDLKALAILVERWHKLFCNKAYWITKDAEVSKDIAQDTWKTVMVKISQLNDAKRFGVWALRIVCSKSFDWLRQVQRNRDKQDLYAKSEDEIQDFEEIEPIEKLKTALLKGITALPFEQQEVIRLFYVEDYSLKDMSELLKVPSGTVKSRLYHAREKLKTILNKQL